MHKLTRRSAMSGAVAVLLMAGFGKMPRVAAAQTADQASAFVDQAGKALIGVVNAGGSAAQRAPQLKEIVDRVVDSDAVARFCLGRFWRTATPEQQKQYLELFHQVLLKNITGKLGDFTGVTFAVGRTTPGEGTFSVATVVTRPNTAPANVDWVVSFASGSPRIIDVVAEGTSLRLTQRSDYASYLSQNNSNVTALLDAMRKQLTQPG